MRRILWILTLLGLAISTATAQDPLKVDPKHYKLEFENNQVRVLRVTRGPHGKTPLHEHPNYIVVYLSDAPGQKAGAVVWRDAIRHEEENTSDKTTEVIVVELKPETTGAK